MSVVGGGIGLFLRELEEGVVVFLHGLKVLLDDGVDLPQLLHLHDMEVVLLLYLPHQFLLIHLNLV